MALALSMISGVFGIMPMVSAKASEEPIKVLYDFENADGTGNFYTGVGGSDNSWKWTVVDESQVATKSQSYTLEGRGNVLKAKSSGGTYGPSLGSKALSEDGAIKGKTVVFSFDVYAGSKGQARTDVYPYFYWVAHSSEYSIEANGNINVNSGGGTYGFLSVSEIDSTAAQTKKEFTYYQNSSAITSDIPEYQPVNTITDHVVGEWNHVDCVYDLNAGTVKHYVNGTYLGMGKGVKELSHMSLICKPSSYQTWGDGMLFLDNVRLTESTASNMSVVCTTSDADDNNSVTIKFSEPTEALNPFAISLTSVETGYPVMVSRVETISPTEQRLVLAGSNKASAEYLLSFTPDTQSIYGTKLASQNVYVNAGAKITDKVVDRVKLDEDFNDWTIPTVKGETATSTPSDKQTLTYWAPTNFNVFADSNWTIGGTYYNGSNSAKFVTTKFDGEAADNIKLAIANCRWNDDDKPVHLMGHSVTYDHVPGEGVNYTDIEFDMSWKADARFGGAFYVVAPSAANNIGAILVFKNGEILVGCDNAYNNGTKIGEYTADSLTKASNYKIRIYNDTLTMDVYRDGELLVSKDGYTPDAWNADAFKNGIKDLCFRLERQAVTGVEQAEFVDENNIVYLDNIKITENASYNEVELAVKNVRFKNKEVKAAKTQIMADDFNSYDTQKTAGDNCSGGKWVQPEGTTSIYDGGWEMHNTIGWKQWECNVWMNPSNQLAITAAHCGNPGFLGVSRKLGNTYNSGVYELNFDMAYYVKEAAAVDGYDIYESNFELQAIGTAGEWIPVMRAYSDKITLFDLMNEGAQIEVPVTKLNSLDDIKNIKVLFDFDNDKLYLSVGGKTVSADMTDVMIESGISRIGMRVYNGYGVAVNPNAAIVDNVEFSKIESPSKAYDVNEAASVSMLPAITEVAVTFNNPVASIADGDVTISDVDGNVLPCGNGKLSADGCVYTMQVAGVKPNTEYTITVPESITSQSGAGMVGEYNGTFVTTDAYHFYDSFGTVLTKAQAEASGNAKVHVVLGRQDLAGAGAVMDANYNGNQFAGTGLYNWDYSQTPVLDKEYSFDLSGSKESKLFVFESLATLKPAMEELYLK